MRSGAKVKSKSNRLQVRYTLSHFQVRYYRTIIATVRASKGYVTLQDETKGCVRQSKWHRIILKMVMCQIEKDKWKAKDWLPSLSPPLSLIFLISIAFLLFSSLLLSLSLSLSPSHSFFLFFFYLCFYPFPFMSIFASQSSEGQSSSNQQIHGIISN